jgi:hypothetical protein
MIPDPSKYLWYHQFTRASVILGEMRSSLVLYAPVPREYCSCGCTWIKKLRLGTHPCITLFVLLLCVLVQCCVFECCSSRASNMIHGLCCWLVSCVWKESWDDGNTQNLEPSSSRWILLSIQYLMPRYYRFRSGFRGRVDWRPRKPDASCVAQSGPLPRAAVTTCSLTSWKSPHTPRHPHGPFHTVDYHAGLSPPCNCLQQVFCSCK